MASITRTSFSTGNIPSASEWNTQFDTVYNRVNTYDDGTGTINTGTITGTQVNADNLRLDGNTISSTDTNGDINITPDGTGKVQINGIQSYILTSTGAGHGSTNTKIRRIETAVSSSGSAITQTNSSTNGTSFTINEDGVYSIIYTDSFSSGADYIGISLNSSQLTTNIQSITSADLLAIEYGPSTTNTAMSCSATIPLSNGDVIRPHTTGNMNTTSAFNCRFLITKVR